jgi:hypothetical protein
MPLILPGNVGSATAGAYNVDNSLRFNDGSSDHLDKTLGTATNRKKFTISVWFKKCNNSNAQYLASAGTDVSSVIDDLSIHSSQALNFAGYESSTTYKLRTNALLRDTSAWYNAIVNFDSTQGTDTNRLKMYLNGTQVTSFSSATYPSQNLEVQFNKNVEHMVGRNLGGSSYMDGYIAEFCFIDGQALDQTSFGEFDEDSPLIWKPKNVKGLTFGDNGFYLEFKQSGTSQNSSGLGADTSGNSNHFAVNNLTALDQSTDTCTNNFCTLNPLSADEMTFSNGNLDVAQASDDGGGSRSDDNARGTMGVNSGKWYWETKLTGATAPCVVGICFDELRMGSDLSGSTGVYAIQNASTTYAYRRENGTTGETSGFPNPVANNIMNIAFDADNAKLYLGINGTYYNQAGTEGNPATGSNPTFSSIDTSFFWLPWIESRGDNQQALMNFGSGTSYSISSGNADGEGFGNFEYAVPSGYFALCTKNLAEYG